MDNKKILETTDEGKRIQSLLMFLHSLFRRRQFAKGETLANNKTNPNNVFLNFKQFGTKTRERRMETEIKLKGLFGPL